MELTNTNKGLLGRKKKVEEEKNDVEFIYTRPEAIKGSRVEDGGGGWGAVLNTSASLPLS